MALYGFSAGYPIDPERVGKSAHEETARHNRIDDIFSMPGVNAVSRRFRDVVESFEPGVHQFFPLALFRKDDAPIEGQFFVFNCTVSVDTVLATRSDMRWTEWPNGMPALTRRMSDRIVHSSQAIAGRHVWCRRFIDCLTGAFVSDALHTELKARKIKAFKSFQCEEVDEPWNADEQIGPQLDWLAEHPERMGNYAR